MTTMKFAATPAQVQNLIGELQGSGTAVINAPDGSFTINGHGIRAQAKFNGTTLTVTVESKPFYIPISAIESGILEHLKAVS